MAYSGGGGGGIKGAAGVALTILVVVIVGALARGGTRQAIDYAKTSPTAIEAGLESAIQSNPSLQKMYGAMKQNYPEKYEEFVAGVSESARKGEDINSYSFYFMRQFTLSLREDFQKAPSADVQLVLDKHVELMETLSDDSQFYCGQFAFEGLQPDVKLSPKAESIFADANALQMSAAVAGRAAPVVRQPPSEEDWAGVWSNMLSFGTTEAELQLVLNGTLEGLSEARKCKIGKDLYKAIATLPPEVAARIGASLLIPE